MRPSSLSTLRSPYDESSKTAKPTSHVKGKTCNASQKLGKGGSVAGGKSGRQRVSNKSAPTSRNELRSVIKLQAVDLKRVKEEAVVLTADQVELRRRAARELAIRGLEERQKREADEHARKVADARSKLEQECAALTQEQARERQAVVERAEWLRESQIDRVKRMDQLVNYALCATMRSKQIEEKQRILKHKEEEDERLNAIVEETRKQEVDRMLRREESRKQLLREGAALIRQQMAERDEQRLADKAAHEEEVRSTLERIRQLQEDEKRARAERQRAQHALLEEISKINAAAVEAKHRAKIETQEEDARIMEYLLRKEEEQDRLERQEAERKQQREKEIAELRSMQQRAVDTNAQMDELRAQKAAFEFEQEGRRKEAEAAEKKEKERKELREERERQRCAREHAIAIEANKLKEEFMAAVKHQELLDARIAADESARQEHRRNYIKEVSSQIASKDELQRRAREEFFKEGEAIAREQAEQLERLESIRRRKLAELRALGVPDIFTTELQKLRFDD